MQINKISKQPNFTSIYKIQNYPVKTGSETLNYILKDIEQAEKSTKFFYGKNPVEQQHIKKIEKDLKKKSESYSFFKRHSNNTKIQIPDKDMIDVWIFTKKDKKIINKFYKKFNAKNNFAYDLLSQELNTNSKDSYKISHLFSQKILNILDRNSLATEIFQELIKDKQVINLSELFNINYDLIVPFKKIINNIINLLKKIF